MPRYVYRCGSCQEQFCVQHLSEEVITECGECGSGPIKKVLTSFSTSGTGAPKFRVGKRTEDFIKEARQDLHEQKSELDNKR